MMRPVILRPYQAAAIEAVRAQRRQGKRRILLTLATGGGKTVIACEIIRSAVEHGSTVLVTAHRRELVNQFWGTLNSVGIVAGILRGRDERTDPSRPVQVGTVDTLDRRELPSANIVIVDECHRVPGERYQRILAAYPDATILGLTATPCRLDGKPLSAHFDALVEVVPYSALIREGAIVAPIVYSARRPVDLSGVGRVAGDYNEGQLQMAMRRPNVIGDVVKEFAEKADGRSGVLFASGVEHSKELVERFVSAGIKAEHLDGTMSDDERDAILIRLELGGTQLVSNVDVLTEGWDQPRVKLVSMCRPTLSLTKHMQTAGRMLRPWNGVTPILLDHADNCAVHGLPHEDRHWTLDGKASRPPGPTAKVCGQCFAYVATFPCPLCGFVAPRKPRTIVEAPGQLKRVSDPLSADANIDPRRMFFDKQAENARKKGFKPGFAAAKFKEKFGDWPPYAWTQALKASVDEAWTDRMSKRERERAFWAAKNEEKADVPESDPLALDGPGEEFFSLEGL